jgi:hypothetical protein
LESLLFGCSSFCKLVRSMQSSSIAANVFIAALFKATGVGQTGQLGLRSHPIVLFEVLVQRAVLLWGIIIISRPS